MRKALVVAVLLVTTTCFADSFDIRGTLTSPFSGKTVTTFTGTIEIDAETGSIVSWFITMPRIPAEINEPETDAFTFTPASSTAFLISGQGQLRNFLVDREFEFTIANNTLVGFTGSAFSGSYGDPRSLFGINYSASGTIGPAVAPEPSTLFLVGSGLAGMFCFGRKQIRRHFAAPL